MGLAAIGPLRRHRHAAVRQHRLERRSAGSPGPRSPYSTLAAFVISNVTWFKAIGLAGANRASLYANLQPFLGAVFAVLVLSETLEPAADRRRRA